MILVRNTETNQNKLKKMFFGFAKQTKKQPKQIEFWFVSVRTEKKINDFEDLLIEDVFWRFFRFALVCFEKIRFVSVVLIPVRNTETNQNKPKNNRNRLSFGLFRFEPKKKFDCFEDTQERRNVLPSSRSIQLIPYLLLSGADFT